MLRKLAAVPLLIASLAVGFTPTNVHAADGDFDITFDNDGKLTTTIGNRSEAADVAIQSDGKIVVAVSVQNGASYDFGLVRYNTDGSLDNTFDGDGKVIIPVGSNSDFPESVLIQPDGKILVGGASFNGGNNDFAIVRVTTTGTLDPTFGSGGKVITPVLLGHEDIFAMGLQSDGKIVVAGYTINFDYDFAVVRYLSNGVVDNTFGSSGEAVVDFDFTNDTGFSLVVQSDDKIVVVGATEDANPHVGMLRLTANGSLDNTFGIGGKVTSSIGTVSVAREVLLQSDGRLIVIGYTTTSGNTDFLLVRYSNNGIIDPTFGSNGSVTSPIGTSLDYAWDGALQSDGKIIVVGDSFNGANTDFVVARYLSTGQLDATFGNGGVKVNDFGNDEDAFYGVAIQSDGKIIGAGSSSVGSDYILTLARYRATSTLSTLASMSTSSSLNATFSSATTSYSATVPNATKTFSITPTLSERNASVTVNGTAATSGTASNVALKVGVNNIVVKVVAQDGATSTTYTVSVIRDVGTLKVKKSMSLKAALATVDTAAVRGAKTSIEVKKSSRKKCSVVKGKIKAIKVGNCSVTISTTAQPTSKTPRPKTVRTKVTIRIV